MYLLEKICKEIGVEVGEEWIGVGELHKPIKCKIENNTLWIYHKHAFEEDDKYTWKEAGSAVYEALLKGRLKPAWKPKNGETYYFPYIHSKEEERYVPFTWEKGCKIDKFRWDNNLVFKTEEDAVKATNKMIKALKEED